MDRVRRTARPNNMARWRCESLEARMLLSSFTPEEVYLSELVNRARSDPQAESARLGFDLTDGLTADEYSLFGAVEPLALNLSLTQASRAHSLDMVSRAFFDHINPDGDNPTDRARASGYGGVAGEAIASGHTNIDRLYESWMASVENRVSMLSLIPSFDESFHYDQIGPGFATDLESGDDHYTAKLGDPGSGSTAWLLGVVFTDKDADDFYSIGEGAAGVRVDVAAAADPDTVVATFETDGAGNYQLELGDGSWIVTFTDLSSGDLVVKQVATDGENVKLDTQTDELEAPVDDGGDDGGSDGDSDGGGNDGGNDGGGDGGGDGGSDGGGDGGGQEDDHADDGDYPDATLIALSSDGLGEDSGIVNSAGDTDLFYFNVLTSGLLTATLDPSTDDLTGSLTLQTSGGVPLAFEFASAGGSSVELIWNVPAGEQFFLVVGAADQGSTGEYSILVEVAPHGSDDDGDDGGSDGGGGSGGGGSDDGDGESGDGGSDDDSESPEDDDPPVDATSDGDGSFTVVRTDENGRPIVYFQDTDGSWTNVDLLGEAGGPTPEGRFSTFVDPDSGTASVLSATSSGLAVYSQDSDGRWSVRNLSAELDAAPIDSSPVAFETRTGLVYVGGLDADGNLVVYRHSGNTDTEGRSAWAFEDLTGDHIESRGLTMPGLRGSSIISYVTTWNGLTLAGLDDDGNVHAAWWAPGMDRWTLANLSDITGAPSYEGTISAYLTPWSGINIAGTDENGDLAVVWWVPSFGGEWRLSRLNQLLDGPRLTEGSIASWVTPWGGLNVSGLTEQGDVVVYWWAPTSDGWQITTLSDYIRNVEPPARGVIGHTSNRGEISIMGLSEAGDLVRYWWEPGGAWQGENLSI